MKLNPIKPALLLVIFGSFLILMLAKGSSPKKPKPEVKLMIEAVSITEKQSKESLN